MIDILLGILGAVLLACLWLMLYDSNRFVVKKQCFCDRRIRQSCRAVVLADLHNKCYGKGNERLLAAIRECEPDFILIAGDMLTAKPGRSLETALHFMAKLAGEYPVYYGNGNHEHRLKLYPEKYGNMGETYEKTLKEMGVRLLVNTHVTLPKYGISVYGAEIDRFYYKRFGVRPMEQDYLEGLLGRPDPESYSLLLAHNPDYFPQYAAWGADLVLSGHVHGGMVRIPFWGKGVVSPNVRLFPKYDGGLFEEGNSRMLLSRGLGMHTIPIRLFNPAEVLCVELHGAQDAFADKAAKNEGAAGKKR